MSTQYESVQVATLYPEAFNVAAPTTPVGRNVWPRQAGVFIRRLATQAADDAQAEGVKDAESVESAEDVQDSPGAAADKAPVICELVAGQMGLVPRWVKSASDAKLRSTKLATARSEMVTTSNNFRDAWLNGQRCIVPMVAFVEDDWRSGKAVPTRITRVDGKPMGVAGLWERWTGADGEVIISFTLLTVNANSHALMHRYQQPGNEKRMPVVLNEGAFDAWLSARPEKAREFMRAYPANWLTANPVEKSKSGKA
ncbi:MAG: SOS response-associated peptidase [Gammaproteobacteria bacterium]|nr:SOS response-associated peptidase [Gammaproteobacteria bacterium]MBU0785560.1 SOS response-associated peptidase [Gammaproteobacteria bacterium]MBU0816848.1 SOS response-associated peptidase [Gammaproteobacteria bacterium]MBU1787012.1 SOS response-associated peptidase [Gammaproteobacteria bacterium]